MKLLRLHDGHAYAEGPMNEHMSNYDYLLQQKTNGQHTRFKEFLRDIESKDLIILLENNSEELGNGYSALVRYEILDRCNK